MTAYEWGRERAGVRVVMVRAVDATGQQLLVTVHPTSRHRQRGRGDGVGPGGVAGPEAGTMRCYWA